MQFVKNTAIFNNKLFAHPLFPWFIFVIAFVSKLIFINHHGIWLDESFTLFHAQGTLAEIWQLSVAGGPNPPLFMYIIHFWIKLAGIETEMVRLVPIFFHAMTAMLLFKTGKILSGNAAAIITVTIFFFSYQQFYFAYEIRNYGLSCFLTVLSLYSFIRLKTTFSKKYLALLFLSNLAMVYSQYFCWFVILNQFVFVFFYIQNKQSRTYILISFVVLLLCFLPILYSLYTQFKNTYNDNWRRPPYKGQFINEIYLFLNHKNVFILILFVFTTGIVLKIYRQTSRLQALLNKELKNTLFLLCWFLIPYLVLYIIAFYVPMFTERYFLFCTIGLYLFIGAFTAYLFEHVALVTIAAISIGWMMLCFIDINRKDYLVKDVRESVAYAQSKVQPETMIWLYPYWTDTEFMYYFNKNTFKDYRKFYEEMNKQHIYQYRNFATTRRVTLNDSLCNYILVFQDCGEHDETAKVMHRCLSEIAHPIDSMRFTGSIKITVYEKQ